jgi:hypothetical protein
MSIQITKNKSISFPEYIYNIIGNNTSTFAAGWGFYVSIDDNINNDNFIIKKPNTYNPNYRHKARSLETIRENSIKSFPSVTNLLKHDRQKCNNKVNIDEISETMFDMDIDIDIDIENGYNSKLKYSSTDSYKKNLVNNNYYYGYNVLNKLYTQIANNIYFFGVVILYGSAACIKTAIA